MEAAPAAAFERFLTADEAAKALKKVAGITVSPVTLVEGRRSRGVPGHKINGKVCFRLSELLKHYTK